MNTRQNVPIEDDNQAVGRSNPAPTDGVRTTRRGAISTPLSPNRPDGRRDAASAPRDANRMGTGQRVTIDLTESPVAGRPTTNEPVVRMDVDREQTLEPMDVEGLGMGVQMGLAGLTGNTIEDERGAEFWNIPGAAAFLL